MNITLRQLQAFIAVARSASFSRAAEAMSVTQPALTLMIQKLESQLGIQLLERRTRSVRLSPSGREFLPTIQRLIGELELTVDGLRDATLPRGGSLAIGCIPSAGAIALPRLIKRFSQMYPHVRISVKDAMTETRDMIQMLRRGEIDLAMGAPSSEDSDITFEKQAQDRMVAVLPAEHRLAHRKTLGWRELGAEPLVVMSYHSHVRQLMDSAFSANGLSVRPYAEVSLVATAVGMARSGLGAAVLPEQAVRMCNEEGLAVVPLVKPAVMRQVGFLYRSFALLPPAAQAFVRMARDAAAKA
ncbi:MAG TPA: LysR substrate-binding domain-containing protein [Bordetella sp.]